MEDMVAMSLNQITNSCLISKTGLNTNRAFHFRKKNFALKFFLKVNPLSPLYTNALSSEMSSSDSLDKISMFSIHAFHSLISRLKSEEQTFSEDNVLSK